MNREKDYSISCARFIAIIFIVICHIMQYHNMVLAWWFNVGVQMFLFISGYLYGNRKIGNSIEFYKKTFKKILIDYEIYIIAFIFIMFVLSNTINLTGTRIIRLLTFSGTVNGLEHLWFIPLILFCYLITPIIIEWFEHIKNKSNVLYGMYIIITLLVVEMSCTMIFNYFNGAWVNCFILGIVFAKLEKERPKMHEKIKIIVILLAIFMNSVQICFDYIFEIELSGLIEVLYLKWCNYAHIFLGIVCLLIIRKLFNSIECRKQVIIPILELSDKYSYDIYIVHQFYILGMYSVFGIIESKIVATIIILLLTIISAVILKYMSEKTNKILDNKKTQSY